MSLQLPPELLRLVVDNFRLPPFSSPRRTLALERETRSALRYLSLTSRTFRQIAQPLLFDFIRISNFETLSLLAGNNAENGRSLFTRSILYEGIPVDEQAEEEEALSLRLFRKLSTCTDRVEELIVYKSFHRFESISAASLKRLFLSNLELDAVPTMPCLEVLGLYDVRITSESQLAQSLPSVRHLTFDNCDSEVSEEDATLLTCLAPQLDSIILLSDIYSDLQSEAPSLSSHAILVTLPWNWWNDFKAKMSLVVNLRLQVSDINKPSSPFSSCSGCISEINSHLSQCSQLETVYLPPTDSIPFDYRTECIVSALHQLSLKCQERNIEVVYEEQSDQIRGECQISEEFMRRMTRKRIEREAKVSNEE